MAIGRIELNAEIEGLDALLKNLSEALRPDQKSRIVEKAMQKAIKPVVAALERVTPLGPTGNLRRAIASKVVRYPLDGNAVGVVGFQRAGRGRATSAAGGSVRIGPDRAFHQWWLEEGTQERFVGTLANKPYIRKGHTRRMKSGVVADVGEHSVRQQGGYIASSFKRLGPFKMQPTPRPPRGQEGQRVQTQPGYPNAFFKKSSTPITIPAMTPGGSGGTPPLKTAFDQTQTTVAEILSRELRISLEQVWANLSASTSARGTIE
jgi:hypothetical protein